MWEKGMIYSFARIRHNVWGLPRRLTEGLLYERVSRAVTSVSAGGGLRLQAYRVESTYLWHREVGSLRFPFEFTVLAREKILRETAPRGWRTKVRWLNRGLSPSHPRRARR